MSFFQDLRFAWRLLKSGPLFSFTVIGTLALVIGANAAIFSVVDQALLRGLPYPDPDRLASVAIRVRGPGGETTSLGHDGRTWEGLRARLRLTELAAVSNWVTAVNFAHGSSVGLLDQQRVTAGFFRVLGVDPWMGREFTEEEDRPGGPAVAVISHGVWSRIFREDPAAVGRSILIRGEPHTVVGVMPPGFRSSVPAQIWTPLRPTTTGEGSGQNYEIVGRIQDGRSFHQASSELEAAGRELLSDLRLPPGSEARFSLVGLQEGLTRDLRSPLYLLWGAVALVLAIGCVNLAALFLARGALRSREIAARIAIGGPPRTILRQLLTESLLYGLAGGAAGLLLGDLLLVGLRRRAGESFPFVDAASLDVRVVLATGFLSLLACLAFGIFPAVQACRADVRRSLAGARGTTGGMARAMRLLVLAQVALAVPLLVSATLLVRSFVHLWRLEPGFEAKNVFAATLSLHDARYETSEDVRRFVEGALPRVSRIPGVEGAALSLSVPYERWLNLGIRRVDQGEEHRITTLNYVTPDFYRTLRIPLLRGRSFTDADGAGAARAMVVSRAFIDRYFQDEEPLGAVVQMGDAEWRIVGVVGDVPQRPGWGSLAPLEAAIPAAYIPAAQATDGFLRLVHVWFSPSFVVRTAGLVPSLGASMEEAIAGVDALLPVASHRALVDVKSNSLALPELLGALVAAFAGLATVLVGLGLYATVANSVAARGKELSLRMALGATVSQALMLAAGPGLRIAGLGVAVGMVLSLVTSRSIQHLLWGVEATDPRTLLPIALAALAVTAVASLLPALRVARFDPARVLREE